MKVEYKKIKKDQFLEHIMKLIPVNYIIYKILTGIRATSLMLGKLNIHNLILIVPNVPVIKGKCKFYNKKGKELIKGVYEGITVDDIVDYLNSDVTPKKFITTPESYYKIKDAIEEHPTFFLFQDFYLLFDECERLVQDAAFRPKMFMPMNDFFEFTNKALISATPIHLSDPRFEEQKFKKLVLKPTFNFRKDLTLIETNNIEYSLQKFIQENPREHYFIFHNSTDSIGHIIRRLNILEDSAVFCARDSKQKLKENGLKNIYTDLGQFNVFNFLTSRFFSAVDIHFKGNPTIIILTDLHYAEHTAVDPLSEAIQIAGRFRDFDDFKPKKEIIHITNFNPQVHIASEEAILKSIEHGKVMHQFLRPYLAGATTIRAVSSVTEILERIEIDLCITPEGEINHYLKDNRLFEEKVKQYYTSSKKLIAGYRQSKHFNVTHLIEQYTFTDKDRIKLINASKVKIKTIFEILTPKIVNLEKLKNTDPRAAKLEIDALRTNYPKQMLLLEQIGLKRAKELRFNIFAIRKELERKIKSSELSNFGFIDYLKEEFTVGRIYMSKHIIWILANGIRKFKLVKLKANLTLMRQYFKLSDERKPAGKDKNNKHQKGYLIEQCLIP